MAAHGQNNTLLLKNLVEGEQSIYGRILFQHITEKQLVKMQIGSNASSQYLNIH